MLGSFLLKEWQILVHLTKWYENITWSEDFSIIKDFDSDAPTHPQENTSHTQKTCHSADISRTKFCAHWNKQNSSWGKWREQEYTSSPAELPKQCSHDWLLSPMATACLIGLKYPFDVPLRRYFIHSFKTDHKILLRHREKRGTSRFPLDALAVNKNSSVKAWGIRRRDTVIDPTHT